MSTLIHCNYTFNFFPDTFIDKNHPGNLTFLGVCPLTSQRGLPDGPGLLVALIHIRSVTNNETMSANLKDNRVAKEPILEFP